MAACKVLLEAASRAVEVMRREVGVVVQRVAPRGVVVDLRLLRKCNSEGRPPRHSCPHPVQFALAICYCDGTPRSQHAAITFAIHPSLYDMPFSASSHSRLRPSSFAVDGPCELQRTWGLGKSIRGKAFA